MIDAGNPTVLRRPSAGLAPAVARLPQLQRRHLVLAPIFAAHAALLLWIAADRVDATPPRTDSALAVFDVLPTPPAPLPSMPTEPVAVPVPAIILPPPIAPPIMPLPVALPALTTTELPAPVAGGCDLTDTVQAALRADPAARAALASLPPRARSVANAVMLWDGRWIGSGDEFGPIRTIVLAALRSASADCRAATQAGPRLIVVAGRPDFVLAVGSGRWRWGDLDPLLDAGADAALVVPAARLSMR